MRALFTMRTVWTSVRMVRSVGTVRIVHGVRIVGIACMCPHVFTVCAVCTMCTVLSGCVQCVRLCTCCAHRAGVGMGLHIGLLIGVNRFFCNRNGVFLVGVSYGSS